MQKIVVESKFNKINVSLAKEMYIHGNVLTPYTTCGGCYLSVYPSVWFTDMFWARNERYWNPELLPLLILKNCCVSTSFKRRGGRYNDGPCSTHLLNSIYQYYIRRYEWTTASHSHFYMRLLKFEFVSNIIRKERTSFFCFCTYIHIYISTLLFSIYLINTVQ